jgi:transcriptional regulator with XRE-family HTH domain
MISHDYDGLKIALLREAKEWGQADLARATKLSQPTVWALEHQVTKKPKAETLMKVAAALGVPLSKIMRGGNNTKVTSVDQLAAIHDGLTPENRQALLAAAEALLNSQKRR